MKAGEIMTENPITITPHDTIGQAEELMGQADIRQLPVVQGKELVGIITDRDIRSFLSGKLFGAPEEMERELNTKIGSIMTTKRSRSRPMTNSAKLWSS